jgi:hypothetical protein
MGNLGDNAVEWMGWPAESADGIKQPAILPAFLFPFKWLRASRRIAPVRGSVAGG